MHFIRNRLMKRILWVMGMGCLVLTGCANQYPSHIAYTDTSDEGALVTGIQTYQFNLTTGPRSMQAGAAAPDGVVGEKTGTSTRHSTLFGLVEWGNNGVGEAASQGGIREVRTVQNGGVDILWGIVYSEQSTLVTGIPEYSNRLPIQFPHKPQVLREGMFMEPNGNLVVKNSQDQLLDFVKNGEVSKVVKVDQKTFSVSYGFEKSGERTVLIEPHESTGENILLINDQIVTFQPKACLVITLGEGKFVKSYSGKPSNGVKIQPIACWEDKLAMSDRPPR
ncbi:MAG: hypothetical protein EBV83_06765 [Verrucomicrobia bacterium]|nr:hypothetical protein [Verrucomicrobiota bacterium]